MVDEAITLSRVLITNDDGIEAPGLALLAEIAASFAEEIWIVAPIEDQSGASQKLSLRQPLHVIKRGERRMAVTGTPSDCVAIALDHLMEEAKPDLVLSGVNPSSNTGDELTISGTVGAAVMALKLGVPSIAISQQSANRNTAPWATTRFVLPPLLPRLLSEGWRKETCLCVNIPDLPPEKIKGYGWARQGRKTIARINACRRVNPRGETYFWLSLERKSPIPSPDNEAALLGRGEIAITTLGLDGSLEVPKPFVPFISKADDTVLQGSKKI